MKAICPYFSTMAYRKDEQKGWMGFRIGCGSWQCEVCAADNRNRWRVFLGRRLAKMGLIWWFGTITAPSWHRTPETSLKAIRDNFDRFMKRLKRVFKKGIEYVRVYEKHKQGSFHLHIIISGLCERVERYAARSKATCFRPAMGASNAKTWHIQTWWKKTLSKCGCGYIAEVKIIPTHQAVKYVTKYLTKEAQNFNVPNLRRIQTSRGIGSPKPEKRENWRINDRIWGSEVNYQSFKDLDTGRTIPAEYWIDHAAYPDKISKGG